MIERLIREVEDLRFYETGGFGYGHTTAIDRVIELLQSKLVEDEPKDTDQTEAFRQLIAESWGALGWLEGHFHLSDRSRVYKINKLRKALAKAEACFTPDEPTAEEVEQAAWTFWTERVKALLVEAEIPLKKPDASFTYHKQMKVLYQLYLEGKSPEEVVPRLIAGTEMLDIVRTFVEVKDVKQS